MGQTMGSNPVVLTIAMVILGVCLVAFLGFSMAYCYKKRRNTDERHTSDGKGSFYVPNDKFRASTPDALKASASTTLDGLKPTDRHSLVLTIHQEETEHDT